MSRGSAIIIGSGVAGLASAIRLAVQGFQVDVYEQNGYAGGKLSSFKQSGFSFDAGPSLFTQPENIEALFLLAKENIEEYIIWHKLDTTCNYFFENGKKIIASADIEVFAKDMKLLFNEDPMAIKNYLATASKSYNNIGSVFLNYSLHKTSTFFNKRIFKALKSFKFPFLFESLSRYNHNKFNSPEAIQLFNRYATYSGSNPYQAPAMLSMIPHLEMNQGTFYPNGGMISIKNALLKLAQKKGVQFHFNSPVQKIMQQNNKAVGIKINNQTISADIIVSNCDVYFTYKNLLTNEIVANKIVKQERSSSALIFYWGIKKEFQQLGLHNIFFGKDYEEEFNKIFKDKTVSNDPTVYINITSKMEKGFAPLGYENWFVMINVPANSGQDWEVIKAMARKNIIKKLNNRLNINLEDLIETETILDPILIETNTQSYMGSLYGTSSNSRLSAFWRHPNFTSKIKNLYFVGGSVHPGGGIPLCLKSAKIMAEIVEKDKRK